ncbi:hypothetical protein KR52_11460 [Synechococcus sp. KORDI-52]|nr:hypothetical protein KR52_11460 [Synechococcus sp. KORDI-52]
MSKGFVSNAEVIPLVDQSEVVRSYLRGELDVVQLTTVDILDVCSKLPEQCPVVVLVLNESVGGDQIMSFHINNVDDLAGTRVAVASNSFGPFVLHKALMSVGLTIDDLSINPMVLSDMPEALATGVVDAAVLYPPNSEKVRSYGAQTIFDSSQIPGQILDVLAVSPSVVTSRPDDVSSVVASWFLAHRYASEQEVASSSFIASSLNLSIEQLRQTLKGIAFKANVNEQKMLMASNGPIVRNIESVKQVMEHLNLIRQDTPSPVVSDRYLP